MYRYILDVNRSLLSKDYYALSLKEQNRTPNMKYTDQNIRDYYTPLLDKNHSMKSYYGTYSLF